MMTIPEDNCHEEAKALLADIELAQKLFAELEAALLELKEKPEDIERVNRVFRSIDNLKGGSKR